MNYQAQLKMFCMRFSSVVRWSLATYLLNQVLLN
ncbi:Uncharacterised protein [Klebsiella pneumoniae]|nr:Uncharacterised protein [Klebsiella pneumoniae]VGJ01205.1 Uncharacterised protein [Klebsiella pneumoniae]VGJ45600.1 Uncharacterised protein [Klebsiella pneumoniae]